jgi:hypothetical protein
MNHVYQTHHKNNGSFFMPLYPLNGSIVIGSILGPLRSSIIPPI